MDSRFSQIWLDTTCKMIPDVHSAIFVMPDGVNRQMRLMAKWPTDLEQHDDLLAIVKYCLKKSEPVCMPSSDTIDNQVYDFYALPIQIQSTSYGAVVIRIEHLPESKQKQVFSSLKRSIQWLRLAGVSNGQEDGFYSHVVSLLASSFEQGSYHQGLIRMVAELTAEFQCERVAFAEYHRHHCRVIALSNSAEFDQRSNLVQMIADAMDEAIEQDDVIQFPDPKAMLILRAHQELARKFGSGSLCTIPLVHENQVFGAITLLSSEDNSMDSKAINLCQQTLSLMTPFLALKRDQEKGLFARLGMSMVDQLKAIFGFRFLKTKLAVILVTLLLVTASLVETEYRVSADAILEGKIQRVIAAPISGYLLSASVRAGDTVRQGDVLASLNDSDLRLEQAKLNGFLQKSRREYRQAQSTRDLVKLRVVKEQINQANAEIELNRERLAKIRLTAPFDGIVIEGDLTQLLGSPVERGDSLFKIAPLEGYRIILKVDESQISRISQGQTGTLALSSFSNQKLELVVEKIIAVAKADDGANIFRVEASLVNAPAVLRPGMEGIGKIDTGQARLLWIWTHKIVDRISLWLWLWWP